MRNERESLSCDICGAIPDEHGWIEHGRGCFSVRPDGGGYSFVELPSKTVAADTGKPLVDRLKSAVDRITALEAELRRLADVVCEQDAEIIESVLAGRQAS